MLFVNFFFILIKTLDIRGNIHHYTLYNVPESKIFLFFFSIIQWPLINQLLFLKSIYVQQPPNSCYIGPRKGRGILKSMWDIEKVNYFSIYETLTTYYISKYWILWGGGVSGHFTFRPKNTSHYIYEQGTKPFRQSGQKS